MRAYGLIVALLLILSMGCASDRQETENERLWRQGYGFNNPNRDRIRNGENPVNMDGSVSDR